MSVMLVDDDEDTRELLAELLRVRGFEVRTACSGDECLRTLATVENEVAVVVTDVEMPGMSGLELCRVLRNRHPNVVAVVMSGRVNHLEPEQLRDSGAVTFISKPTSVLQLERILVHAGRRTP